MTACKEHGNLKKTQKSESPGRNHCIPSIGQSLQRVKHKNDTEKARQIDVTFPKHIESKQKQEIYPSQSKHNYSSSQAGHINGSQAV
jgi:hypothetical protein